MRFALLLCLLPPSVVACAASPSAAPPLAEVPSPTASAANAAPGHDAGESEAAPAASAAPVKKSVPWCDAQYQTTPCAFRAYGLCYTRQKSCAGLPCTEPPPSMSACPAGDAPAFMTRSRVCGRKATDPVTPQRTGWSAVPPECDALLTTWSNVPTDDRACKVDSDCVDVAGTCFHATLNVKASTKGAYAKPPCSAPGAGACSGGKVPVRCESGCCVEQGGGFGDHADVPFAPPP